MTREPSNEFAAAVRLGIITPKEAARGKFGKPGEFREEVRAATPDPQTWPAMLDDAAYHGVAGDVVRTIEPHTEADPAALLVQFLAYAGACIGRGPYYLVEGDRHYPNIFAVLVGQSAKARKGTSQGRIRHIFEMIDDPFAARCIKSGLSSGEGLIWAIRDGDGDEDPGVQDKRLLIAESEFAGLLRVMDRQGNTISRNIRDAWDRGDLATMTKNDPNRATGAHVSIVGHITDDELRRYLDRTECANGFANRFLYVAVKRSKLLPHGGSLHDGALQPVAQRLASTIDHARHVERVTMDDAARTQWEGAYAALSEGQPGLYGAVTGRAEAQVIRLALIYALLDRHNRIGTPHLQAALSLWRYCDRSARYIFGDATGDPVADSILRALRESQDGLTRTAISASLGRHASSFRIDAALSMLAAAGRVSQIMIPTGGRPSEVWNAE